MLTSITFLVCLTEHGCDSFFFLITKITHNHEQDQTYFICSTCLIKFKSMMSESFSVAGESFVSTNFS